MRLFLLPPPCMCIDGSLHSGTPPPSSATLRLAGHDTRLHTLQNTDTRSLRCWERENGNISRPSHPATTHRLPRLTHQPPSGLLLHLPPPDLPLLHCFNRGILALFRIFLRWQFHLPSLHTCLSLTFIFLFISCFHFIIFTLIRLVLIQFLFPLSLVISTPNYLIYVSKLTPPN